MEKTPGDRPAPRGISEPPGEAHAGSRGQFLGGPRKDADVRKEKALDDELEEGDPHLPGLCEREEQIGSSHRDWDTRQPAPDPRSITGCFVPTR